VWWDILKKPYVIRGEIYDNSGYEEETEFKLNKLFQGSQGKTSNLKEIHRDIDSTLYWTPRLNEAVSYAFFGSFVVPFEKPSYKDLGKPTIKQTLPTKNNKYLDLDTGYGAEVIQDGENPQRIIFKPKREVTPRGRERPSKIDRRMPDTPKYNYLPDSRVKELGKELLQKMKNNSLSIKDKENLISSAGITKDEMKNAIEHLEMMLSKYFGGFK
tara:strand:+ start:56 stop:697 length:642 start_codon:yes stop_codon:yes gene_type:complete